MNQHFKPNKFIFQENIERINNFQKKNYSSLLRASVLGNRLGSFRNGVLGKFTWKQESNSSLDFSGGDGGPLVVMGQSGGFGGNPFENIVDETVHDGHGFGGNAGVWVDLLENLVDVDREGLLPLCSSGLFLVAWGGFLDGFFGSFGWRHFDVFLLECIVYCTH